MSDELLRVLGVAVGSGLAVGLVWAVLKGYRRFDDSSMRRIEEMLTQFHVDECVDGVRYVTIDTYVYWGFFNTLTTLRVVWNVPEDLALRCLSELLRFNLSRGIWGAGALFVPFVSIFSTWRQRAKVKRMIVRRHGCRT